VAYESGAANTVDPLAGSYFIESLTDEIEKHAHAYLAKIDALGGMLKAIERGFVQQEIQNAAYEYQRAVDAGAAVVVGVNRFAQEQDKTIPIQRIDEALERQQIDRVRALRAKRDEASWKQAIAGIQDAARSGDNLMPRILAAVEAYATVGEISDAMRGVFGEYRETVAV
jgi:methylmalonyl-CoA mutase N-terminal domain/subunit